MQDNKPVMVVTGASSGVGRAVSIFFADKGYAVCALARSHDKLKELEKANPANIRAYPTDVSRPEKVVATFERIMTDHDRIDVLINNAGLVKCGNYWEQSLEDIDNMVDVNLKGTMYCTHTVLNLAMIPNKAGNIINISSVAGTRTGPRATVYHAAKYGQIGFGFSIGQAVLPHNILVSTLCPGGINTPLWQNEHAPGPPEGVLPTDFMEPVELAETIEFILQRPSTTLFKQMIFFPTCDWN